MDDNPYTILGVTKDATDAEIKRVYRKLARQYHPDRNPNDAAAEEKFKSIQSAYDKIGTKDSRKEYDNRDRMNDMFGNRSPFSGFGGGGFPVQRLDRITECKKTRLLEFFWQPRF